MTTSWGIGSAAQSPQGVPGSHRPKVARKRYGDFTNDWDVQALAERLGLSVKRVQRDLTLYRKKGIIPTWAEQ